MDFGFTLKPDHSIERTIALTRQAEAAGFGYGWLFDAHVPFREVYPLLTLMAINTTHMRLGLQVIIEDYVHDEQAKLALLMANTFFAVAVALASAFAILTLSFKV